MICIEKTKCTSEKRLLSTSFLISPSLASAKSILLFSKTNQKFSLNACSFLGLYSVEIKLDGGYRPSGNYRPILYQVISFIQ